MVDFAVLADYRVKLKKSERRDKYWDLARELKKTMEHVSDSDTNCLGKGLVKRLGDTEIRGQVEAIQTIALSRSTRILRQVLETWRDLLSLKLRRKTIS